MTTRFTDDLMEHGLTQKILTLVSQIDLNNEFDKLQRERGLGSEKHRKEVKRGLDVTRCDSSKLLHRLKSIWSQRDMDWSLPPHLDSLYLWKLLLAYVMVTTLWFTIYHRSIQITTCISVSLLLSDIRAYIIFSEEMQLRTVKK